MNHGNGWQVRLEDDQSRHRPVDPHALAEVTKGNPWQRSMGNYAKLTPSGANAPTSYQDIVDMATLGTKVR